MNEVKEKMMDTASVGAMYCPLCNHSGPEQFHVLYTHKPEWEIMVCDACSFTFIPDVYLNIVNYDDYKDESTLQYVKQGNNWVKLQRQKLRVSFLKKYVKQGKILDVGAGWGHFMHAAVKEGFIAKGIEMDRNSSGYAQSELGLDVQQTDFRDLQTGEQYDVITMWDVLEHMENPKQVIEKCALLTRDEGYILIQVPQIDSFFARLQKERWIHLGLEHINYFSRKTIRILFEEQGYEVLRIKSSFELKFLLTHSLAHRLKRKKKTTGKLPEEKSKFFADKAASPADGAALFNKFTKVPHWVLWCFVKVHNVIYNIFSALNIGEEMMVVARKKRKVLHPLKK